MYAHLFFLANRSKLIHQIDPSKNSVNRRTQKDAFAAQLRVAVDNQEPISRNLFRP
jgi:hypothetical protein